MEEKILIKSEHYNFKRNITIAVICFAVIGVILFVAAFLSEYKRYEEIYYGDSMGSGFLDCEHTESTWFGYGENRVLLNPKCNNMEMLRLLYHKTVWSYMSCVGYISGDILIWFFSFIFPPLLFAALCLWFILCFSKYNLTITDTRIYGKKSYGKSVDLLLDNITSVEIGSLKGIDVGTSSGKVKFKLIKNNDEVYAVLGNLVANRKREHNINTSKDIDSFQSNADELKKFKDLLDKGIITQEEFDAKKKQLLGL